MTTRLFIMGLLCITPLIVTLMFAASLPQELLVNRPEPTREQLILGLIVWGFALLGIMLVSFALYSKINGL